MKKWLSLFLALTMLLSVSSVMASETVQMPEFTVFREAVDAAGEEPILGGTSEHMAVILEKDGHYYRVVAMLDEKAKELDEAISAAEDIDAAFDAFYDYVWTLPVTSIEVFTAEPKSQETLDALVGKTFGELEEMGYVCTSSGTGGEEDLIIFEMSDGLYAYEFVADAGFDLYMEKQENDELNTLTVKSGKFVGASYMAADLRYHADGTVEPEPDPFEDVPDWMMKLSDAFTAIQNGEEIDIDALIQSLAEEYPDAALMIQLLAENLGAAIEQGAVPEDAE